MCRNICCLIILYWAVNFAPSLHRLVANPFWWRRYNWWCRANLTEKYASQWPIYRVSCTILAPSLYIWPVQITQSYGDDCPANTMDGQMLKILSTNTYNQRFLANPTNKYARQCSEAPRLWLGAPLHWLAYLSVRFSRHRQLYRLHPKGFATFVPNNWQSLFRYFHPWASPKSGHVLQHFTSFFQPYLNLLQLSVVLANMESYGWF